MKFTTYITVEIEHDSLDVDQLRDRVQATVERGTVGDAIFDDVIDGTDEDFDGVVNVRTFIADRKSSGAIEPLVAAVEELTNSVKDLGWDTSNPDDVVLNGSGADHAALLYQFIANANIDNFWGPA